MLVQAELVKDGVVIDTVMVVLNADGTPHVPTLEPGVECRIVSESNDFPFENVTQETEPIKLEGGPLESAGSVIEVGGETVEDDNDED